MNIAELCTQVYEESEGRLNSQAYLPDGTLLLEFECDDWNHSGARRRFELRCEGVKEARVSLGCVGYISLYEEHPLLMRHRGEQCALYFSSAPISPELVFTEAHLTLYRHFGPWLEPNEFLHGTPSTLITNLKGGYGLLAEGPKSPLLELRKNLDAVLTLQLIDSRIAQGDWVVLILERSYVVCTHVSAREV